MVKKIFKKGPQQSKIVNMVTNGQKLSKTVLKKTGQKRFLKKSQ